MPPKLTGDGDTSEIKNPLNHGDEGTPVNNDPKDTVIVFFFIYQFNS